MPAVALKPELNLEDLPEVAVGDRACFESRSKHIHWHWNEDGCETVPTEKRQPKEIERMFPSLDPTLVQALMREASSPEVGLNTLLALVSSLSDPACPQVQTALPPRDLGVEDEISFPSLTDAEGWQIVSQAQLQNESGPNAGFDWAARAKVVSAEVRPTLPLRKAYSASSQRLSTRQRFESEAAESLDFAEVPTDYELQQQTREQRLRARAKHCNKVSARQGKSKGA